MTKRQRDGNSVRLVVSLFLLVVVWLGNGLPVAAIEGGRPAPGGLRDQAIVALIDSGGGLICTGSLVAPDLVLTAGHCLGDARAFEPEDHDSFNVDRREWPDWEHPDRFYPIRSVPGGVRIEVRDTQGSSLFITDAPLYAKSGNSDMALLSLTDPVPRALARPLPVLTFLPGRDGIDPGRWVVGAEFTAAGFGADRNGDVSPVLKEATLEGTEFPCLRTGDHKLCVNGIDGTPRGGDSGSPLLWTDRSGQTWVAGVLQSAANTDATYTATWYRGGVNSVERNSMPLPNLGSWLERHLHFSQGYHAFLRSDDLQPADRTPTSSDYSMNPGGLDPYVEYVSTGRYVAHFPSLGSAHSRVGRSVSVTSFDSGARYCKLDNEPASDRVPVACYDTNGNPSDAKFSLLSLEEVGVASINVTNTANGGVDFVSDIKARVSRIKEGVYIVAGVERTNGAWRYASAGAVGNGNERCNVAATIIRSALITCSSPDGEPVDADFHFEATNSKDESYAQSRTAATGGVVDRRSSLAGVDRNPTITKTSEGTYDVRFDGPPPNIGGNVQASINDQSGGFCNVADTSPDMASVTVTCYDTNGDLADSRFGVRVVDPIDVGVDLEVALNWIHALIPDDCREEVDLEGTLTITNGATGQASFPEIANQGTRLFLGPDQVAIRTRTHPGSRYVEVVLNVTEIDGCDLDEAFDLAPNPDINEVRLRIDLHRYRVEQLDPTASIQSGFGYLTSGGRHSDEHGRTGLYIDIDRPIQIF